MSTTPLLSRLLAVVLSMIALPVLACAPPADSRTYAQRLAAEPLAFVGTVTALSGRKVTFTVHHAIAGHPGAFETIHAEEPSTCAISFSVGQRWLYAGNVTGSPSVLVVQRAEAMPASELGRLRRVHDARLGFPATWQSCTSNAQCVPVAAGCDVTAAQAQHATAARARAVKVAGNPAVLNCAAPAGIVALGSPQCIASKCGQWVLDLRIRP